MPHARTCPRCRSRRGHPALTPSAAIVPEAFPLHGAAVSFGLVLGISHVSRLLAWPRLSVNSFITNPKLELPNLTRNVHM
jgi:hypothetical protein